MKVALVDDHPLVLDGLKRIISESPEVGEVHTFNHPKTALEAIQVLKPNLVFVDFDMPEMNGLELAQQLKSNVSNIKVILLTMNSEPELIKKAMALQLDGYLLKSDEKLDFLTAVSKIANNGTYFSPKTAEALVNQTPKMSKSAPSKTLSLTPREREILIKIAEGLSTKEIAEALFISPGTVETHRKALIKKLEVKNMAGLVRIAVKEGLV